MTGDRIAEPGTVGGVRRLPGARRTLLLAVTVLFVTGVVAACGEPDPPPPPPPPTPPTTLAACADSAPGGWFAVGEGPDGTRTVEASRSGAVAERQAVVDRLEAGGRRVLSVEADQVVSADVITDPVYVGLPNYGPSGQWGIGAAGFPAAWAVATGKGSGVRVGIIDTGVQASHPDLAGAVVAGADFVGTGDGRTDGHGHGTHVAGIVAARIDGGGGVGGAPAVTIVPVRVLDCRGSGSMSDVVSGIYWAVDTGAVSVINLSLGGGSSTALRDAVQYAVDHGVVVAAAAGNCGCSNQSLYPGGYAAIAGELAVAATDAADARSSFSTVAGYVSIAAPGTGIWSTVPTSTWGLKSGTSMATPFVSAAAALVRSVCPGLTPAQVEARLTSTALDLGTPGVDSSFGAGRLRADAAVTGAC